MRPGTTKVRGTGEGSLGLLPPGSDPVRNLTAPRALRLYRRCWRNWRNTGCAVGPRWAPRCCVLGCARRTAFRQSLLRGALGLLDAALDRRELDVRDLGWRGAGEGRGITLEVDDTERHERRELRVLLRSRRLRGRIGLEEGEGEADARRRLAVELRVARLHEEVLVLVQAIADADPVDACAPGRGPPARAAAPAAAAAAGEE